MQISCTRALYGHMIVDFGHGPKCMRYLHTLDPLGLRLGESHDSTSGIRQFALQADLRLSGGQAEQFKSPFAGSACSAF